MDKKEITIYDFDHTLYRGDTVIDFWLFTVLHYPLAIIYLPYQLGFFFGYIIKKVETGRFKEAFLSFINLIPSRKLKMLIALFWKSRRKKINHEVYKAIQKDREHSLYPVCISASPKFLLHDIVKELGIVTLISTDFLKQGEKQTNMMVSPNCKGEEKLRRLKKWAKEEGIDIVVKKVMSDSSADLPLYALAESSYYMYKGTIRKGIPKK